jgi:hypothetical protein
MGLFDDMRRSFREGRATGRAAFSSSPRDDIGGFDDFVPAFDPEGLGEVGGSFDPEGPPAGGGDELAECKAVIAGLLQEKEGFAAQLEQWSKAVAERDEYIATLHDERDRACAERDQLQAAGGGNTAAQLRELESLVAFPGAKRALEKVTHPDTGKADEVAARTAAFQTLMAVCARLKIK